MHHMQIFVRRGAAATTSSQRDIDSRYMYIRACVCVEVAKGRCEMQFSWNILLLYKEQILYSL